MRFCLITTFFGAHSFGGDAVFVERLAGALARQGHDVDVVHCVDAFESVRGDAPLRSYKPPDGVRVHALQTKTGRLSPLWTHQTGRLGPKARPLRQLLAERNFDVFHVHNISLIGADVIELGRRSAEVALMTAHEHWLACPLSVLWKFDERPCDGPQCARCTLHARRPPQLWRKSALLARSLERLDALICPSDFTLQTHRRLGVHAPFVKLPYFIPDDWATSDASDVTAVRSGRPYVATAGRLVKSKGLQRLIPLMAQLPELDLLIAGAGPFERDLRRLATGLSNIQFLGLLDGARVRDLLAGARAAVVPSLVWETFGYGVLEAFSVGTPAIVSAVGALPEVASTGGGGIVCRSDADYLLALHNLAQDDELRDRLGSLGRAAAETIWSEATHLEGYLALIADPRSRSARAHPGLAMIGAGD